MAALDLELVLRIEGASVQETVQIARVLLDAFNPVVAAAHNTGKVSFASKAGPQLHLIDETGGATSPELAEAVEAFRREISSALDSEHGS